MKPELFCFFALEGVGGGDCQECTVMRDRMSSQTILNSVCLFFIYKMGRNLRLCSHMDMVCGSLHSDSVLAVQDSVLMHWQMSIKKNIHIQY